MNSIAWLRPWRSTAWLVAGALCAALPAGAQGTGSSVIASGNPPPTMKQALDAAWQRSLEAAESRGRQGRAQAEQAVAESWLAAPPAISLSQREGRTGLPEGNRETALGVSLPLWRPGQRAAGEQAALARSGWTQAAEQADRLRLAGQLREAVAAASLAAVELRQAERQAETLRQLADDVTRRVRAGDLAPADALAARAELLAAQAQVRAARQTQQTQQAAWRLLTGLEQLPASDEAMASAAPVALDAPVVPESHPELVRSRLAVAWSQRRVDLAQGQRPNAPELTLGVRQERPGAGAGAQSSLVVGLRLPVGGQVHQQPRIASELAELDLARAQEQRTRDRLAADLLLAASQWQASQAQWQAERERAALLGQRAALIDRSFRAGESPLPELLRALGAAAAAEAAQARQQLAHRLSADRLQHALGWLP